MTSNRLSRYFLLAIAALLLLLMGYKGLELGIATTSWNLFYYYGVPLFFAVTMFSCAFLPVTARSHISVWIVAIGIGLLGAEIYLALTTVTYQEATHRTFVERWEARGIDYDGRPLLEVVEDLRDAGTDAYPKLNPATVIRPVKSGLEVSELRVNGAELVPLSTISNTVSVYCNESGEYLVYKSDEFGFHNPANLWSANHIQIAALGDSFTEGACVSSEKNMVSLIRGKYATTLNLGMGGNGPLMQLAGLTEYLTHKSPEIVLWFFFDGNDLIDLHGESQSPLLMRYLDDEFTQNLFFRQASVDETIRAYMRRNMVRAHAEKADRKTGLFDILLLRNLRDRLSQMIEQRTVPGSPSERELHLLRRILSTAKTRIERWGGDMVLVYVPGRSTIRVELEPSEPQHLKNTVLAMMAELDIRAIDMTPDLAAPPGINSRVPFPQLGHFNERGYRTIADKVMLTVDEIMKSRSLSDRNVR